MNTSPAEVYRPAPEYYLPQGAGIDIKDLLAILKRRRWVILSTVLLMTTLAVLVGLQITPKYTAKALVMIDPRLANVVDVEAVVQGLGTDASTVETQMRVIKSRDSIERVMDQLALFDDPEFNLALETDDPAGEGGPEVKVEGPFERLLSWVPDEWLIASGLAEEPLPVADDAESILEREAAIEEFDDNLKVTQEGRSYVIAISFTSEDPEKAASIANAAAELYVQNQLDTKLGATSKATDWLGERLDTLREEVERAETAVEDFRAKHNLSIAQGVSVREQRLFELNRELSTLRANYAALQAKLRLIRELRATGRGLETVPEVLNSETIVNLREREAQLLKEESELRSTFGDRHPRIQNLRAEKATLIKKINDEVERILSTIENEVAVEGTRVAAVEKEIEDLEHGTSMDRGVSIQLNQLEREAEASRQLYESFLVRYKETREQQGIIEPDSQVISVAAPPDEPSSPGPKLFGAVGFTASLMMGTLLALLLERLDSGLRSGRQVEQALELPALGLVPRLERLRRRQKPHQYLLAKPLSAYAEAIRAIYTSLQLSDVDSPPKMVLITSSLPQEGKTTLALSLATFAAGSGQKVLLMDVDLRHPSVHRDLGTQPAAGLVEYMAGEKTLDEVLVYDEESGVCYLPIKRQTANPTDLLGSQKMRQLFEQLRADFDFIVVDSAPLMGVTDTKVVARMVDKVVFATQWDKTTKDTAQNALAHLREAKASVAGVVLTQVDIRRHAEYGYGDVGQYYGKYQKYYVN